jgi:hypothetical protein
MVDRSKALGVRWITESAALSALWEDVGMGWRLESFVLWEASAERNTDARPFLHE